jgi:hypothetical protein
VGRYRRDRGPDRLGVFPYWSARERDARLTSGNVSARKWGIMIEARCVMIIPERVSCEICLKEVPKSEAAMSEAADYVAYFCGLDCYRKWLEQGSAEAPPKPAAPAPRVK